MNPKKNYRLLITEAFRLLIKGKGYEGDFAQKDLVKMLNAVGGKIAPPTLTKLKNEIAQQEHIPYHRLKQYGIPLEQVVELVLGLIFDTKTNTFLPNNIPDWQATNLLLESDVVTKPIPSSILKVGGRWTPDKKVAFFQSCQKELIEFGIKLENFASYFEKYGDDAYQNHIITLLKNGVNVKCYMIDPNSERARIYFEDRNKAYEDSSETEAFKRLPSIKKRLIKIAKRLNDKGHKGQFQVYTYDHIPYNHFLTVDKDSPHAKMLVAHYIYGIARSKSPLLVFSKKEQPALYDLYLESLEKMTQDAKRIFPI